MAGYFWRYGGARNEPPVPGAPALEATEATVRYPGVKRPALHRLTFAAPVGARVALVGPNGSGKSTLLKAAAGLLPLAAGSLTLFGRPVGATSQRIAYLPQRGEVDWRFPIDVQTLVLSGRYGQLGWLRRPGEADRRLTQAALERLGLGALGRRQVSELSGGQQQRAMLARALVQDADLLLLDEPMNAVDAETRAVFAEVLDELRQAGKTVIVATHDTGQLEREYDRVLFLLDGEAVPPRAAPQHPRSESEPAWVC